MELFDAVGAIPMPDQAKGLAGVPQHTLTTVATRHEAVTKLLYASTGIDHKILSFALVQAMQFASISGVANNETCAQSIIDLTTKIALRTRAEHKPALAN